MKFIGKKQKMTTIFKENRTIGVTPIVFESTPDWGMLSEGGRVNIAGITKGKGFQGVVKRHGFHGGPKTHGQKNRYRAPGSIGSTAPQRVVPGRRMAGRMGGERVTIKNVVIVKTSPDENKILIEGAVPGTQYTKLEIRKSQE